MQKDKKLNYISLFSSAGVGCYGFKLEGFECIATNEIIERRLQVQKNNNKCKYPTGYISGDIKDAETKQQIFKEIQRWKDSEKIKEVDVLIATPPCQGISVANHKKKNEIERNSLIIESIKLTGEIQPKFFVFENVRSFLNTLCTDLDGNDKSIKQAIEKNLGGKYNILSRIINFKSFGNNSSRTRTVVIGTRKDLVDITPYDLFPDQKKEKTLLEVIGHLKNLKEMGEVDVTDIYHNFKSYAPHMFEWIKDLKEGESAFNNKDINKRPYKLVNGKKVINQNKNGDKYTKCQWSKVAPCIHTRNDILASQSTIHPVDNRVFSIRELMLMMSIPTSFKWVDQEFDKLNSLSVGEKKKFLAKEEINIRQSIGEAVPTEIFRQIAAKINGAISTNRLGIREINNIINNHQLTSNGNLIEFVKQNSASYSLVDLLKIAELSNMQRQDNASFYTRQDICFSIVKELPDADNYKSIKILEPSVGVGNFLPLLIKKYSQVANVEIDVFDVDNNSLNTLKEIIKIIEVPKNIMINFINQDFLLYKFDKKYDVVVGNPPFGKIVKDKNLLKEYKRNIYNDKTNNIFSFFVEKAINIGQHVALISPKSILSAPEFNLSRDLLSNLFFKTIIDYGEKAFDGVKIETIGLVFQNKQKVADLVKIESYITGKIDYLSQDYIFDKKLPVWVIYRNSFFDSIIQKLRFGIFDVFRDRCITKKHTAGHGEIRVLKSRNIQNNKIVDINDYDSFMSKGDVSIFSVGKFLNKPGCVLVPNLTYNPRACFMPEKSIADGSVAILTPKQKETKLKPKDLEYYSSEEFKKFYMIAKNFGTRSLNIDSNFVYFFGVN